MIRLLANTCSVSKYGGPRTFMMSDEMYNREDLNAELMAELECPVCLSLCIPPIFMCTNGHIVCHKCKVQLYECGECRVSGTPIIRCRQLEKIANLVRVPCKNQPQGCQVVQRAINMEAHVSQCEYSLQCLFCHDWKGAPFDLKDHANSKHPTLLHHVPETGSSFFLRISSVFERKGVKRGLMMLSFKNDSFWVLTKHCQTACTFATTIRLFSNSEKEAARYNYTVEFATKQGKMKSCHHYRVVSMTAAQKEEAILLPSIVTESYNGDFVPIKFTITQKPHSAPSQEAPKS